MAPPNDSRPRSRQQQRRTGHFISMSEKEHRMAQHHCLWCCRLNCYAYMCPNDLAAGSRLSADQEAEQEKTDPKVFIKTPGPPLTLPPGPKRPRRKSIQHLRLSNSSGQRRRREGRREERIRRTQCAIRTPPPTQQTSHHTSIWPSRRAKKLRSVRAPPPQYQHASRQQLRRERRPHVGHCWAPTPRSKEGSRVIS